MRQGIRHVNIKTDKVSWLSEHLANNAHFVKRMNLRKDVIDMPAAEFLTPKVVTNTEPPKVESNIREDVLSLSMDDLKGKYEVVRDWAPLARELGLMGNHKATNEEKLINKIKTKLSE